MNGSLQALEDQYVLLRSSVDVFKEQSASPEQMDVLRTQIVQSRTNYWKAINSIFHDDDPEIERLVGSLQAEQVSLQASLKKIENVSHVISAITKAVEIGSQVVAKAVAL